MNTTVAPRAAVLAAAALIALTGVLGWPAVLLGAALLVWFVDVRHRFRSR